MFAKSEFYKLPATTPEAYKIDLTRMGEKHDYAGLKQNVEDIWPRSFHPMQEVLAAASKCVKGPSFFRGSQQRLEQSFSASVLKLRYSLQEDVEDAPGNIGVNITYASGYFSCCSEYLPNLKTEYQYIENSLRRYFPISINEDDPSNFHFPVIANFFDNCTQSSKKLLYIVDGINHQNAVHFNHLGNRRIESFSALDYFKFCKAQNEILPQLNIVELYKDGEKQWHFLLKDHAEMILSELSASR